MSNTQDTGGPAYPYGREWNRDRSEISRWEENGMTLLDYFAAQVAGHIYSEDCSVQTAAKYLGITAEEYQLLGFPWSKAVAIESYKLADAMIAEKRRRESNV